MSGVGRVFATTSRTAFVAAVCRQSGTRTYSVSAISLNSDDRRSYRVVVVGGGTAGCSVARKFASRFGKGNVAVVEPTDVSVYSLQSCLYPVYTIEQTSSRPDGTPPLAQMWA